MSLLVRAITSPPEGHPPQGVLSFEMDGITVWATPLAGDHPPFTKEDVLANHHMVSEIFSFVRSCLPFRFPTEVENLTSIDPDAFVPRLEQLRDACELAVTAVWRPPLQESTPPVTPSEQIDTPGRRYLQQRQLGVHQRERAEHLAEQIVQDLAESLLEESRTVCPSERIALSLALLVRRDAAEIVKSRIPRTAQDVRILINGPWPPYTFAAVRLDHTHGRGTGGAQA